MNIKRKCALKNFKKKLGYINCAIFLDLVRKDADFAHLLQSVTRGMMRES